MLFLYPKNTTDFTNNGDPIHHSYDEHVIRDDGFYLTFNLLLDKEEGYKKVKKEMIIGANTPDGPNQFRVYDVKKKNTHVEVTAVQLMYDFDNKEVNPFSIKNATGNQVITRFRSSFKSSLGQFTMDSSVSELHDFATNEVEDDTPSHNALEVLNRITSRWDSELMLNGFDIRIIKRLGNKTDALLYEKKNISEFEDSSSVSGMATRIHATSKFTPEGKENEVTLSVTVDSPLINEYAQIYEKSFVNNECRTEAELIAWAKLKYSTENIDKPSRSITVATNIIDGTEINYGDDLVLKYLVHDVDEVIRCGGYDYDPIRKTYYSVTLGDWKDSFLNTVTSNIVDSTNKQFNQLKNNITYVSMSANGKNRNAYGPEPVPNPINGDQWYYYELDRPNDVELRVYQDSFWVKFDFFATKNEVEGALTEAEKAKQEAIESYNNAIADAATYTNTKAQEFDNQLLIVNQDLGNTKQAADSALTKADQAILDAGFAKVDASSAKQNAITALSTAQQATQDVNTLTTSFDELTQTVSLKANKTLVDDIKGTVDQNMLAISANSTAINARLTETQINSLLNGKNYVNQTDLNVTANGLNASITQVSNDLNNLEIGGRNLLIRTGELSGRWLTGNEVYPNASPGGNGFISTMKNLIPVVSGDSYTFTKQSSPEGTDNYWRVSYLNSGRNYVTRFVNTDNLFKVIIPTGVSFMWVSYPQDAKPKIEKGNKATDWTPAPEDMATLEQFTTIDATVKGLQTTVGNKADNTRVAQLANQWTQTTELANGHTAQISNLGEQINLRVTSGQVTEAILADKKIKDTRNTNQLPSWYFTNYPNQEVREFKTRTAIGVPGSSTYVQLTTKVPWSGSSGGAIIQTAESSDGVFRRRSVSDTYSWMPWDKIAEAGELVTQINLSSEGVLIQGKRIQLDGDVAMNAAFITRLNTQTLTAVTANIATIRGQILIANVVDSTHIKSDTALITKLFATDANINILTAKTAFINSVKATTITADKVIGGTANFANFNSINFNANSITTGTISGANSAWNLNTGLMTFNNPSTNDMLQLTQGQIQFQNSAQTRLLQYNAEGLQLRPGTGNTGTSLNTSLHLIGGGTGSYQYIQFASGDGIAQRLEAVSGEMILYHGTSGYVHLRKYGDTNDFGGRMIVARIETRHSTGVQLIIAGNSIETPRNGAMPIYLRPQGTGSVIAGDASGIRFNMVASDFVKQSSRTTKTNIVPLQGGLDVINALTPVSYNKIDKLNQGIYEVEKGFISEDSPMVATPDRMGIYDSHITAHLVKAVQELDTRVASETKELKAIIDELKNTIKYLESGS